MVILAPARDVQTAGGHLRPGRIYGTGTFFRRSARTRSAIPRDRRGVFGEYERAACRGDEADFVGKNDCASAGIGTANRACTDGDAGPDVQRVQGETTVLGLPTTAAAE
jgi:hypothetical protein